MLARPVTRSSSARIEIEVDGCVTMFDLVEQRAVALNQTGSTVWSLVNGVRDVDAIAVAVAECYRVTVDLVRADVARVIDELRTARFIAD